MVSVNSGFSHAIFQNLRGFLGSRVSSIGAAGKPGSQAGPLRARGFDRRPGHAYRPPVAEVFAGPVDAAPACHIRHERDWAAAAGRSVLARAAAWALACLAAPEPAPRRPGG